MPRYLRRPLPLSFPGVAGDIYDPTRKALGVSGYADPDPELLSEQY